MNSSTTTSRPRKLLVANRSEIAIRVFRAATELGFRTVAIYAAEDRLAIHRFKADEAYVVGEGKGPVGAYLDIPSIVALAKEKGVDIIHPGYGFLSENADVRPGMRGSRNHFCRPAPGIIAKAWATKPPPALSRKKSACAALPERKKPCRRSQRGA